MKFNIGEKILIGNIPLILVIILITTLSLSRLSDVKNIFDKVINNDVAYRDYAKKSIELLQDRESSIKRFRILQSKDSKEIIFNQNILYDSLLISLGQLCKSDTITILDSLDKKYKYYTNQSLFNDDTLINRDSLDNIRKNNYFHQGKILESIIDNSLRSQEEKTVAAGEIISTTAKTLGIAAVIGLLFAVIVSLFVIHHIVKALNKLKNASRMVSKGDFLDLPTVNSLDELGDLSRSFNEMAKRLIGLEELYKDASPLTRLPGGIAVETIIQNRIENKIPFGFCMFDLDNFKPFNDRYGYSHGNLVIKHTAKILSEVTSELGTKDDFVGHIGGDDFVVVSTPELFITICKEIIRRFDNDIVQYYDQSDRDRGYIISKSRQGDTLEFPIMTISISAIDSNKETYVNYVEVGEVIAELKKFAKSFNESKLVIDKRHNESTT